MNHIIEQSGRTVIAPETITWYDKAYGLRRAQAEQAAVAAIGTVMLFSSGERGLVTAAETRYWGADVVDDVSVPGDLPHWEFVYHGVIVAPTDDERAEDARRLRAEAEAADAARINAAWWAFRRESAGTYRDGNTVYRDAELMGRITLGTNGPYGGPCVLLVTAAGELVNQFEGARGPREYVVTDEVIIGEFQSILAEGSRELVHVMDTPFGTETEPCVVEVFAR